MGCVLHEDDDKNGACASPCDGVPLGSLCEGMGGETEGIQRRTLDVAIQVRHVRLPRLGKMLSSRERLSLLFLGEFDQYAMCTFTT